MGTRLKIERNSESVYTSEASLTESSGKRSSTDKATKDVDQSSATYVEKDLEKEIMLSAMAVSAFDGQLPPTERQCNENTDPSEYDTQGTTLHLKLKWKQRV
ncbi:hypothetical protein Pmani_005166 [Petrolisthes manimaculis]|uniref:Uncharacterized protein n=1 Tax=Petrolisthes manimaculis TaxID=1843537 RepID=A0AAE1QEC3_9EUCA|nr:hypothetical protein Pmani_005166 [Petrolisthes manimaculis]